MTYLDPQEIIDHWRAKVRELESDLLRARAQTKRWRKREAAARGRESRLRREIGEQA